MFISNDNADRAGSLAFGHLLGLALETRGLSYTPHYTLALMANRRRELLDAAAAGVYRYDQLIVLRDTRMPAVLLEAGSIVNRDEELELGTAERRALISAAVAAAVDGVLRCAGAAACEAPARGERGSATPPRPADCCSHAEPAARGVSWSVQALALNSRFVGGCKPALPYDNLVGMTRIDEINSSPSHSPSRRRPGVPAGPSPRPLAAAGRQSAL